MIGTQLGPYEVTAKLGEGGMGEVYRAHDSKLKRDVAIKVLPAAFTEDEERLARFEREAQLLAQLQHPHIASIFGLEESDGVLGLVMELVDGPTLAERLEAGQRLPIDEALAIARRIAEALEEAHSKGIVHRDLKPQNIKAPADGRVKVLDFGLAKALDPVSTASGSPAQIEASPTLTLGATIQGVILGTAAYMAPEQAKGVAVDKRADIWAFGVVLYEMVTGRKLFDAETAPETLAQVLTRDPDLTDLPVATPAAIRRLLRRCLERDPNRRLHDIADARIVIDEVLAGETEERELAGAPAARPARFPLASLAALAWAAVAVGWIWTATRSPEPSRRPSMRLSVQLTPRQELITGGGGHLAFSPDGESLVVVGREDGRQALLRRRLDEDEATSIEGTEEGGSPFFSPDGRWIGFVAGGRLKKVPVEGGRPFDLVDARGAGGATWLSDDTLVFAPIYSDGLFQMPASGGEAVRLTTPDRDDGELGHWWPQPLPGEERVVFTAFRTPVDRSRVGVLDIASGDVRWVVDGGFFGRWVDTGHLLYCRGERLYALPFDPVAVEAVGPAVAVLDDVHADQTGGFAIADVSKGGDLAYVTASRGNPDRELLWLDRDGRGWPAVSERHRYGSVALSPDARRAAVTILGESRDLWTHSLERGTLSRLTTGAGTEFDPVWSRDGLELFYVVDSPPFELFRISAGAPDSGRPIFDEPPTLDTVTVTQSPDGRWLAFVVTEEGTGENVHVRPIDGSEPARPFRASRAAELYPTFSPNGRWLAYESDETGRREVYVEPFPGPGERVQISADGGTEPVWAANGEIFYRQGDDLRVVATRLDGGFAFDPPRTLFTQSIPPGKVENVRTWDVAADGQHVLAVATPAESVPRQVEIVTDWTAELVRLAPPR